MKNLFNRLVYVCAVLLMVSPLVSCGGGGGGGTTGTTGTLSLGLTDAPGDYQHVFVTIDEVQVNHEVDGWVSLTDLNLPQTFDLLLLQNGVIAPLGDGAVALEAGHYNQMRLILTNDKPESHPYANYLLIEGESEPTELRVLPSELKNGIKIVQGFTIEVGGSTELLLDFDADKSVVQANGKKGWHLKPTIKVLETVTYSVSGVVKDEASVPVNGASVSAQIYDDSGGIDPKDAITIAAGTETDSVDVEGNDTFVDGYYFMYLPITQDSFNIVATEEGFLPECQVFNAEINPDGTKIVKPYKDFDFTLTPADATGMFIGSFTGLVESADSAHFSVRQAHTACGMIEVASASVIKTLAPAETEYFAPITLPVGTYQVVVSGDEEVTQVWEIEVREGNTTVLDVYFPTPSVYGIVYDEADVPLPGATISAQVYYAGAPVPEEEVEETTEPSTSDSNGAYYMYLSTEPPINIVATLAGREPQCEVITELTSNFIDFTLTAPAGGTGTISGSVTGLAIAPSAFFSIRQNLAPCGMIEVASFSVYEDDTFPPITLPAGTSYTVVVSAVGETTQVIVSPESDVVADTDTLLNIVFPTP